MTPPLEFGNPALKITVAFSNFLCGYLNLILIFLPSIGYILEIEVLSSISEMFLWVIKNRPAPSGNSIFPMFKILIQLSHVSPLNTKFDVPKYLIRYRSV